MYVNVLNIIMRAQPVVARENPESTLAAEYKQDATVASAEQGNGARRPTLMVAVT